MEKHRLSVTFLAAERNAIYRNSTAFSLFSLCSKGTFSSSVPGVVGGSCDTAPGVTPRANLSQPHSSPGDPGSLRGCQVTPPGLRQFTPISGIKII